MFVFKYSDPVHCMSMINRKLKLMYSMDLLDLGRVELREGSAYLPDTDLMSSDFQI